MGVYVGATVLATSAEHGGRRRRPLGQRRSIATVLLLTIVTLGIWQLVWSHQNGDELKRYSNKGFGGVYLIFSFVFYPVTMFLMASEVEQLYRNEGEEPPITAIWGLWFLLPIIGNLIWYVRIQRSINDYWASHGAAARVRRSDVASRNAG